MTSGDRFRPDRHRLKRAGQICIVVALLLGLAGFALPTNGRAIAVGAQPLLTGGGGGGGSTTVNVTMNLTDLPAYQPSSIVAAPGELVQIQFHNLGQFVHTFTLAQTPNATLPRNVTPAQLSAFFASQGIWRNVTVPPLGTNSTNFSIPANLGRSFFFFASVIPFQFQAGMSGSLNVSARASGPPVEAVVQTSNQFRFVPDVLSVNTSGYPVAVAVQVSNLGNQPHTWTLSPFPGYNLSPSNFSDFFARHPPLGNAVVPTSPGINAWANFTITSPGVYQFICTISGHFAAGMFGYLYVGVAPPNPVAPPSTEIVQVWILIGAGTVLGVGVILAVAAALSGRFGTSEARPKP